MALLRLALVSLAACGQAGAQPSATSGLAAPAGWRTLPELAAAVVDAAKADGVTVDGGEAWGETSRGCYGVWLSLHGSRATSEAVLAGLATEKLAITDVVKPDGDGIVSATFAKPPFSGRLRARLADGKLTALACFANAREPKSCEAACTTLLGGLP
jgi:hypothetical protein